MINSPSLHSIFLKYALLAISTMLLFPSEVMAQPNQISDGGIFGIINDVMNSRLYPIVIIGSFIYSVYLTFLTQTLKPFILFFAAIALIHVFSHLSHFPLKI